MFQDGRLSPYATAQRATLLLGNLRFSGEKPMIHGIDFSPEKQIHPQNKLSHWFNTFSNTLYLYMEEAEQFRHGGKNG
jgi:hypothetical protein